MTTRRWTLSQGSDGVHVTLYEYGARAAFWESLDRATDVLCERTGGRFCGVCGPEWLWRIPVGEPRHDEDDASVLTNSLGDKLYAAKNFVGHRHMVMAKQLESLPLVRETAMRLWPDIEFWGEDDDENP